MAVTKQVYSVDAGWTTTDVANMFKTCFIDAGLMTDWYDTFINSGIEHCILEIQYDPLKTYGKTYYWFAFTSAGAYIMLATNWDSVNHVPTGTQYVDYLNSATNTTANHRQILAYGNSASLSITRFTSGGLSMFSIYGSSGRKLFMISPASSQIVPWIDLDKTMFHHYVEPLAVHPGTNGGVSSTYVDFDVQLNLRRSFAVGHSQYNLTSASSYTSGKPIGLYRYQHNARVNNNSEFAINLPFGNPVANPAFSSYEYPIFTGLPYSPYITNSTLPSDFGIHFRLDTSTYSIGQVLQVSPGVQEWEIMHTVSGTTSSETATPMILARVI